MREIRRFSIAKNTNGKTIASREGRLLCSPRDPEKEAQAWLEKQKITSEDQKIIILGGGIAHHIQAIIEKFPNIKIDALELDAETFEYLTQKLGSYPQVTYFSGARAIQGNAYDAVLSFRPSWTGYEKSYLDVYLKLTQRDSLSEISFKLKSSDFKEGSGITEDDKLWKALRELIA